MFEKKTLFIRCGNQTHNLAASHNDNQFLINFLIGNKLLFCLIRYEKKSEAIFIRKHEFLSTFLRDQKREQPISTLHNRSTTFCQPTQRLTSAAEPFSVPVTDGEKSTKLKLLAAL